MLIESFYYFLPLFVLHLLLSRDGAQKEANQSQECEENHTLEKEEPFRGDCLDMLWPLKHIVRVRTPVKRISLSLSETICATVKPATSSCL